MRFLILSAFVACAAAAPSGLLAPVAVAPLPAAPILPVAYSAIAPTLAPGDIAAAAINAQVKASKLVLSAEDKVRENINMNEERAIEAFWSNEDKKWQALDALKTAEAKLDGSVASEAENLAKSVIAPVAVASVAPAVAVAPAAPVFTPGIIAPVLKTETLIKTADKDSIAVEAVKVEEQPFLKEKSVIASIAAPLSINALKYPLVAPVVIPPVLNYGALPYLQPVGLTPQILASQIGLAPSV